MDDRTARAVFETAFRASPVAMGIIRERDGIIVDVNDAGTALSGRTREEMLGQTTTGIGLWADIADRERLYSALANRGEVQDLGAELVRADGERRYVLLSVKRIVVGGEACRLAVVTDVTEKRATKAKLIASEQRYRRIVETTAQGVLTLDVTGHVTFANARAEAMLHTTANALFGSSIYDFVDPATRPLIEHHRQRHLAGHSDTFDVAATTATGEHLLVEVTCSPFCDASGKCEGALAMLSDVTEQRQLEVSLRESESNLRQLQKMDAIGTLAGGIAHDFNNVLSIIMTSAALIEDEAPANAAVLEDVRAIVDAAKSATTLTRQLLAFSRKQVLEPRIIEIDRVIAGMETMLRRLLGERIDLDITTNSGNVVIDPGQLEQVILNLAVNARDAMPSGGTLHITTECVDITDTVAAAADARPGRYVRVIVRDTGTGMDATTRERMFEPFFTTKDKGKGTGLGLATVFGIVRQSGGFIDVVSAPGCGTTVQVCVPHTSSAEPQAKSQSIVMVPREGSGTILVVEDEDGLRRIVTKLLRGHGYDVLVAAGAGEALLIAEQTHTIDLVLTDVVMPLLGGRELFLRLRRLHPSIQVVYMSGYHDDDVLRAEIERGDVAFLQKPLDRKALLSRIRDILAGR